MKTTIDLADDLAATLKTKTASQGISMRAAVHQALRLWLKNQTETDAPKTISREIGLASGHGLSREASSLSWDELRALSYDR